jgi:hypothetical protein
MLCGGEELLIALEPCAKSKRRQKRTATKAGNIFELFTAILPVEILPATELAKVTPKDRDLFIEFLGPYGAETIAVSGKPGMILWTDDSTQAQLAASTFGAKSWTSGSRKASHQ